MTELVTSITAVTVFPDRARLKRTGKLRLESGVHTLEISGLPLQIEADSVRASARSAVPARLLSVQIQRVAYVETPSIPVQELEAQLEAVQDELRGLEARIQLAQLQRVRLEALSGHTETYATALAAGEMTIDQQVALLAGLAQRSQALEDELVRFSTQKRHLERRQQQLKQQLDQVRSQRPRERFTAFVEIEVQQAGDLEVDLVYLVSHASWTPLYDLRLVQDPSQPSLEVTYLGQVTQQSGENWENVTLSLSTARPALGEEIPELQPWFIGPRPPGRAHALRAAPAPQLLKADMAMAAAERMPDESLEIAFAEAEVESGEMAVTYHLPAPASIPADGAPHKVSVTRFALPVRLDYQAAPKLVQAAYRRARVTNDSPYTLLPGPANLFSGDEFIGQASLELTATQGEFELFLGVDDRLKVERELKRQEVDKSLLGGKRRIHTGYEIRLENHLPVPATLTVQDQIPVARHEEIKVRLESAEPRPTRQSELNLLEWELTLAPHEKRTLRFDFSVEFPVSLEVIGL